MDRIIPMRYTGRRRGASRAARRAGVGDRAARGARGRGGM
ncbi:MAG: hypothetical protein AVDCRST_MAG88-3115 [uncultured Thermomicrobiales bacterium]|uniref:Uncharacterized protein n=1 Tax=uncultured Thermomicrobiales bacterium TaxID=1645740 RepID=A0A6J4VGY5_9BACT|nr:MAG: hypothetical protein AVDCRST_MAG88-3115 [uncultured Thermomicrobiales bacterium]